MKSWVENKTIKKYEDRSGLTGLKQGPLVWTEVFLREVNRQSNTGILHFWPMDQLVILGMMDSRVAQLDKGLASYWSGGLQSYYSEFGRFGSRCG